MSSSPAGVAFSCLIHQQYGGDIFAGTSGISQRPGTSIPVGTSLNFAIGASPNFTLQVTIDGTINVPGRYTYTVHLEWQRDIGGLQYETVSLSRSGTITITAPPLRNVEIVGASSVVSGNSIRLSGSYDGGFGTPTYEWREGSASGTKLGTGATLDVAPTADTTYWLKITVGDQSDTDTHAVAVGPALMLNISGLRQIERGEDVTLTGNASGGSGARSWEWRRNNDSGTILSTSQTLNVSPTSDTTYWLKVTDSSGSAVATHTVTIANRIPTSPAIPSPQVWQRKVAVDFTVPAPTGGDGSLTSTVAPNLPSGVSFTVLNDGRLRFHGTPRQAQAPTPYTLTVRDEDGSAAVTRFTIEVLPSSAFVYDQLQNREGEFRTELQRLAQTNLMHVFLDGRGVMVSQLRSARTAQDIATVTVDQDELLLGPSQRLRHDERAAPNSVRVWYFPRDLAQGAVLWSLPAAIQVPANDSVTTQVQFSEPELRAVQAAGASVSLGSITATANEDGTGADRTVTGAVTQDGPSWATISFTNGTNDDAWLQTAQLTGTIYRSYQRQFEESLDADDIAATGERRMEHVAPYILDPDGAASLAQLLRDIYSGDRAELGIVERFVTEDDRTYAEVDIGQRVQVVEEDAAYDHNSGVEAIEWEFGEDGVPKKRLYVSVTSEVR